MGVILVEFLAARSLRERAKDRALVVFASQASVLMGVGVAAWTLISGVVISAMIGFAAIARGVSLVMSAFPRETKSIESRQRLPEQCAR
jgi:uncharacterized membrane protein HdeD (DUF308 family)